MIALIADWVTPSWPTRRPPRIGKPHIRYRRGVWSVVVRGPRICDRDEMVVVGWGAQFPQRNLRVAGEQLSRYAAVRRDGDAIANLRAEAADALRPLPWFGRCK